MISSRAGESAPPVSCVATAIESAPSTVERWMTQPGASRQSNRNAATIPQTSAATPIGSVGVRTSPSAPGKQREQRRDDRADDEHPADDAPGERAFVEHGDANGTSRDVHIRVIGR